MSHSSSSLAIDKRWNWVKWEEGRSSLKPNRNLPKTKKYFEYWYRFKINIYVYWSAIQKDWRSRNWIHWKSMLTFNKKSSWNFNAPLECLLRNWRWNKLVSTICFNSWHLLRNWTSLKMIIRGWVRNERKRLYWS